MPSLLQINSNANIGSTGRIAEQIGRLVQNIGWNSFITYGRSTNASKSQLLRIGGCKDVYCHGVSSLLLDNHGLVSTNATKRFIDQIKIINPDIIHIHNLSFYEIIKKSNKNN